MNYNLDQPLVDYRGLPIYSVDATEVLKSTVLAFAEKYAGQDIKLSKEEIVNEVLAVSVTRQYIAKDVICSALTAILEGERPDIKTGQERMTLVTRIWSTQGLIELSHKEVSLIEERVWSAWNPDVASAAAMCLVPVTEKQTE